MMFTNKIEELTPADINALVENSVQEIKTKEFKQFYKVNSKSEKGEFLADVSSFANSMGGHIIYGIKEERGMAIEVKEFEVGNTDAETLKLESLIRTGIEPRIKIDIRFLKMCEGKYVLIIFIHKSWLGPHRVIYNGNTDTKYRFYSRNSAGKYPLDILELKDAFNLNNTINEKIEDFVSNRIYKINIGETPIPLGERGKIIMQLIPLESFSSPEHYDLSDYCSYQKRITTLSSDSVCIVHINIDGILSNASSSSYEKDGSYVQLYRNGIIESADSWILNRLSREDDRIIDVFFIEHQLIIKLHEYLEILNSLGVKPPILLYLSFINVLDYHIDPKFFRFKKDDKIDRDILRFPSVLIDNYGIPSDGILKQSIDLMWNACGIMGSPNFNDGKYVKK